MLCLGIVAGSMLFIAQIACVKQVFATTTTAQLSCLRKIYALLLLLLPLRGIACIVIVDK